MKAVGLRYRLQSYLVFPKIKAIPREEEKKKEEAMARLFNWAQLSGISCRTFTPMHIIIIITLLWLYISHTNRVFTFTVVGLGTMMTHVYKVDRKLTRNEEGDSWCVEREKWIICQWETLLMDSVNVRQDFRPKIKSIICSQNILGRLSGASVMSSAYSR